MPERGGDSTSLDSLVQTNSVSAKIGEVTTKEYLQTCFRLKYRARRLKHKGAVLVIVWSFLMISVFHFTLETMLTVFHSYVARAIPAAIGLMLPIAGWLADVYFGRYKVICWSIMTMWISSMLLALSYVVLNLTSSDKHTVHRVLSAFIIFQAIGFGGYQANIITDSSRIVAI